MGPGARGGRGVALALAVALLLAAAAALVTAAGPPEVGQPRVAALSDADEVGASRDPGDAVPPPSADEEPELGSQPLPGWLLVVVWVLAFLLAARAVRRLVRRELAPEDLAPPEPVGDPAADRLRVLGELRREASGAAVDLRARPTTAPDDVVRCWERLEDAAAGAGLDAGPAATASELTSALLAELGADPAASGELLRLYHRARFSSAPLPADAGERAAAAYEAVAASLAPVRDGSRG